MDSRYRSSGGSKSSSLTTNNDPRRQPLDRMEDAYKSSPTTQNHASAPRYKPRPVDLEREGWGQRLGERLPAPEQHPYRQTPNTSASLRKDMRQDNYTHGTFDGLDKGIKEACWCGKMKSYARCDHKVDYVKSDHVDVDEEMEEYWDKVARGDPEPTRRWTPR